MLSSRISLKTTGCFAEARYDIPTAFLWSTKLVILSKNTCSSEIPFNHVIIVLLLITCLGERRKGITECSSCQHSKTAAGLLLPQGSTLEIFQGFVFSLPPGLIWPIFKTNLSFLDVFCHIKFVFVQISFCRVIVLNDRILTPFT